MHDYRDELRELARRAKQIHEKQKGLAIESAKILAILEKRNASVNLGFTKEAFARAIGVSLDVYWKRVQAGRIILRFHRVEKMLEQGELQLSHVNIIAPKITDANQKVLLDKISGRTKREIEYAVATTDFAGNTTAHEPKFEIRLSLTKSQMELLDRAMEVLSGKGQVAKQVDAIVSSLEVFLEKEDPMRKAERAKQRRAAKDPMSPDPDQGAGEGPPDRVVFEEAKKVRTPEPDTLIREAPERGQEQNLSTSTRGPRPAVPSWMKHQIYLRDQGQCTFVDSAGNRCHERSMLELDHKVMWCRGGEHTLENLSLSCRYHNQGTAKLELRRSELRPS